MTSGSSRGSKSYACRKNPGSRRNCGATSIRAHRVEALVSESVLHALTSPTLDQALWHEMNADHTGPELVRRIKEDEQRLDELAEMFAVGEITRREWMAARAPLQTQVEASRRALGRDESSRLAVNLPSGSEALTAAWQGNSVEWRRQVVALIVDRVVVSPSVTGRRWDPGRVEIVWTV